MKIYNYHPETKEYLGASELTEADRNPLIKGEYLIPANAVKAWPTVKADENQTIIFNGSGWSLTPDFRGVVYWLQTGEKAEIEELGDTLPNGALAYDPVELAEAKTLELSEKQARAETEEALRLEAEAAKAESIQTEEEPEI